MALIKSTHAPAGLTSFSMADIETQAKVMLLRARRAAEELIGAAQLEAEALKDQARAEGLAAGRAEGLAKGLDEGRKTGHQAAMTEQNARLTQVWTTLTGVVVGLDAARLDLENAGVVEVIALASAIARRVTKRQAMVDPAVLTENVREAMAMAVAAADVKIAVHPSQRKVMENDLPQLKLNWPTLKHVEIVEDPTLTAGGCRIFSKSGRVDADIEGQLDRVIADLLPETDVA